MKAVRLAAAAIAATFAVTPFAQVQGQAFTFDFENFRSPVTIDGIQSTDTNRDPRLTVTYGSATRGVAVTSLNSAGSTQGFASWGYDESQDPAAVSNTGSTALFHSQAGVQTNLLAFGGASFGITSIDVAPLYAADVDVIGYARIPSFTMQFSGRYIGSNSFFTQTFLINGVLPGESPSYTRLMFDARFGSNLQQVAWFQSSNTVSQTQGIACTNDLCATQFDNIQGVFAPEPGTWALMATGLVGLAGIARRRRSTAA